MNSLLIIGSGGREHALAWKLALSPQVKRIFVAPGNGGTAGLGGNIPIASNDTTALINFARENEIDLTVVGPELPLAAGIVDAFQAAGLLIFGPSRAAAQLEASKAFAKQFMKENDIPTGDFAVFTELEPALEYLKRHAGPCVIKASGLAAGKGVIVCDSGEEAEAALHEVLQERAFGAAGERVLIEERLNGPEVSILAFCDGRTVIPMIPARDHKRAFDHDLGPNTGGMGVYAPAPDVDQPILDEITRRILQPTVDAMAARGTPYRGVLYAGLMLTETGPKVLEFNCRFGDPETQVLLPMLDGDLAQILKGCAAGQLSPEMVSWFPGACAAVVMASSGYPGPYAKGLPITGLETVPEGVELFHAGTAISGDQLVTSGGRVLAVTARGEDLDTAVERAYAGVSKINFEGAYYRKDIGAR